MTTYRDLNDLIDSISPNLFVRIKQHIEDTEKDFVQDAAETQDSFLWEHTLHVASIARQICRKDNIDPAAPMIAALFHDAGKFRSGEYHKDEIPEEEVSASLAQKILSGAGVDQNFVATVVEGLQALYNEETPDHSIANVVHDADFLAKSGHLGVASFFIKGTLRGQSLQRTLTQSLSQELTYASVLPENMRTEAGKKMAVEKSRSTMHFFRALLDELRGHGIGQFKIAETSWPCPTNPQKMLRILMVLPEECPECGRGLTTEYSSEKGIKCTKIVADIQCEQCSNTYHISFCLPEICS
jgi:HD superfamily phosphodiesterase